VTGQALHHSFEAVVLPHLDAGYSLARWLTRGRGDAEDVVQEALVRALTYFPGFRGANARGWFLQIVRNAAYASLSLNRGVPEPAVPDEETLRDPGDDPEAALIRRRGRADLARLIAALEVELRETLILREFEELSYKEIAQVTGAPIGTVMSRLWRARRCLAMAIRHEEIDA
jgi:RNA polymerase sigma-70 factor (ECF subfamily)